MRAKINSQTTSYFLKRMYLEIIFFRSGNKRHYTGSLRIFLLPCATKIISKLVLNENTKKI